MSNSYLEIVKERNPFSFSKSFLFISKEEIIRDSNVEDVGSIFTLKQKVLPFSQLEFRFGHKWIF